MTKEEKDLMLAEHDHLRDGAPAALDRGDLDELRHLALMLVDLLERMDGAITEDRVRRCIETRDPTPDAS